METTEIPVRKERRFCGAGAQAVDPDAVRVVQRAQLGELDSSCLGSGIQVGGSAADVGLQAINGSIVQNIAV